MSVRKGKDGRYRYRKVVHLPDGAKVRISGTPTINTQREADREEREHIERAIAEATRAKYAPESIKRKVPTLTEWFRGDATGDDEFTGRYWIEHARGEQENRTGTLAEKRKTYLQHLEPALGAKRLDEIDIGVVNALRAELRAKPKARGEGTLSPKTCANIITVLGTALRYAESAGVIDRAPAIKVKAVPPPPIECWTFEEYGRLLGALVREGEPWATAVLLVGECGLRVGEMLALEWPDLDLVANTITIVRQERQGVVGPPKGGKSRTVPMTARLAAHLRSVPRIHTGRVIVRAGESLTEAEARVGLHRVCRYAGLPEQLWHRLRHSYATHAALLGANPIRLQHWLGHSSLGMTLRYIHFAESHQWPIDDAILTAGSDMLHPDRRLVAQLGARPAIAWQARGKEESATANRRRSRSILVGVAGFEPVVAVEKPKR